MKNSIFYGSGDILNAATFDGGRR